MGRMTFSGFLVTLRVGPEGVEATAVLRLGHWKAAWSDIARAELGPRSVVLYATDGVSVRLAGMRMRTLNRIVAALDAHEIPRESRRATLGNWLRPE